MEHRLHKRTSIDEVVQVRTRGQTVHVKAFSISQGGLSIEIVPGLLYPGQQVDLSWRSHSVRDTDSAVKALVIHANDNVVGLMFAHERGLNYDRSAGRVGGAVCA